jgi:hypothetical protein
MIYKLLVGGLEHEFYDFPYIGNVIIPTDSYFSEGLKPPTRLIWWFFFSLCEPLSQQKIFQIHRNSHGWPKRGSSAKNAVLVSLPSGDDLELDPRLGPISESIQKDQVLGHRFLKTHGLMACLSFFFRSIPKVRTFREFFLRMGDRFQQMKKNPPVIWHSYGSSPGHQKVKHEIWVIWTWSIFRHLLDGCLSNQRPVHSCYIQLLRPRGIQRV